MRIRNKAEENKPLDPTAMALAIWLGVIVGVTGLIRISEEAAAQAAVAQAAAGPTAAMPTGDFQPFNPRLMAFGG